MGSFLSRCGGAMLATVTVVIVTACGSGASSSTATRHASSTSTASAPAPTSTATTAVTSSPASASSATTPAPAAAAAVAAACAPSHTAVSLGQTGAATGHVGLTLLFRNSGSAPCTLTGYPGAALVTATGRRLQIARTPQGFMGGLSPAAKANPVVRLAPGQFASAILEGEDFNPVTNGACPRYSAVLVTPPNQQVAVRLNRSLSICVPTVHPVVPGTTGRQS